MDGYSKIRLARGTKSRSMDISDFSIFPETPKATETTSPNHTSKPHEFKQVKSPNTHEPPSDSVYERGNGERVGMKLTRNSSVSSASSHMFRFEKQSKTTATTLQSAVKRAFSMSRSSSVSERYCRIHDQCVTLASPKDDDDDDDDIEAIDNNNEMERRSVKKKKKHSSGRILKACKRLFGL